MRKLGIGIDFGTTNSLASVWGSDVMRVLGAERSAKPVVFWHEDGEGGNRPHPSVVWFRPDDSAVVGFEARKNMHSLSGALGHTFIRSIKRTLSSNAEIVHGGRRLKPYEIAAHIFEHIRACGSNHPTLQGHNFKRCVVTVPVGFSGAQRREIRRAMEKAGLELQGFVHEPFAAMVAHFYDAESKLSALRGKRVLVFDWGGGTLDVCLAEGSIDGSSIYELSHSGIEDHAGDDFDRRIMADLRGRFLARNPSLTNDDIDARSSAGDRFWLNAERGKIELSGEDAVRVRVPRFIDGEPPLDLAETITKSEFERLIEKEVHAAAACARRCLDQARLTAAAVDYVLMVGGTSLIPRVRRELEEIFGAKVQVTFEPDAAIARGAAIVAAEDWTAVNAVTIGCKLAGGEFFTFLDRGEPLVASASKRFVFYCTDPRDGVASFVFSKKQDQVGSSQLTPTDYVLQVPVQSERPTDYRDLDRLIVRAAVTEDATLRVAVKHTGMGNEAFIEIADLSFGLRLF